MPINETTVHIVDDDPAIRKALERSLSQRGYSVAAYESAEAFLANYIPTNHPSCLVLDVRMPGMNGLQLQDKLDLEGVDLPIIFITGHGDIPMSVQAIKQGATEFLEKPYRVDALLEKIDEALAVSSERLSKADANREIDSRYNLLTARERDVMALLVKGIANTSNKEIARILDISHRTVDDHRSRIMAKMQARSLQELVEMAKLCGVYQAD